MLGPRWPKQKLKSPINFFGKRLGLWRRLQSRELGVQIRCGHDKSGRDRQTRSFQRFGNPGIAGAQQAKITVPRIYNVRYS